MGTIGLDLHNLKVMLHLYTRMWLVFSSQTGKQKYQTTHKPYYLRDNNSLLGLLKLKNQCVQHACCME